MTTTPLWHKRYAPPATVEGWVAELAETLYIDRRDQEYLRRVLTMVGLQARGESIPGAPAPPADICGHCRGFAPQMRHDGPTVLVPCPRCSARPAP